MDPARPAFCIGVDVGGTFTDVVLSEGTGVWRAKAPSTPAALGQGVINGCRLVAQRAGMRLEDLLPQVVRFGLGTTAVTNVIATRSGRRVGLVTTRDSRSSCRLHGCAAFRVRAGWCRPTR